MIYEKKSLVDVYESFMLDKFEDTKLGNQKL